MHRQKSFIGSLFGRVEDGFRIVSRNDIRLRGSQGSNDLYHACSWMLQFVTLGSTSAFGIYQDHYARERLQNYSPSAIRLAVTFPIHVNPSSLTWARVCQLDR